MGGNPRDPGGAAHQVELILQSVDSLPTLTPVATRVLSIGSSRDADFRELTRLIEADPALTSKIIGLCRRAALGLGDRITTVRRALVMLGYEAVRAAVLSVSVYELISGEAQQRDDRLASSLGPGAEGSGRAFDRVGFWMYSVGVASAAEILAAGNRKLRVRPEEAFVAGLVHGLGKPIFDLLLPRAYGRVLEIAERRRSDIAPIEREVFGMDHHAAGRRIADRWGLPAALRDVVWLYDHPLSALPQGVAAEFVRIVAVARALCRELHVGDCAEFGPVEPAASVCEAAGLERRSLDEAMRRLHEAVSERCKVLGLDEKAPPELLLRSITEANRSLARLSGELEERANEGRRVADVLGAIAEFWRSGGGSGDPFASLGAMARSAARLLGSGRWGAVLDQADGRGWLLCVFDSQGTPIRTHVAEPPARLAALDLAHAATWSDRSGVRSALAAWAGEQLGLDSQTRPLRVVVGCEGDGAPGCVLLTDAPLPDETPDERHLAPLRATWSAAMSAAAHRGATERLAESLADSNRALAAAQARLTETESMVRLGEMTAGAAHEMNNPLTVIRGRAQLLADTLHNESDRATAAKIAGAAADLSDLVTTLHRVAVPGELEASPALVRRVLERAAELAGAGPGAVAFELPEEGLLAHVDSERLARALSELIRNARDWAPAGIVRVRIETEGPDGRLLIRVEDDGPGLSPKAQRHAFDPFFSERPAGRGRGLGLPLAKRLVELHGGALRLEPREPQGTAAIVSLERWRAAQDREAGRAA
ncbi:MAG TPA: HDOD domain-containing protein [Phycisphaerales bacterium]|nr:HDOD domain-containing protein [Phycisphaerales bacterium]